MPSNKYRMKMLLKDRHKKIKIERKLERKQYPIHDLGLKDYYVIDPSGDRKKIDCQYSKETIQRIRDYTRTKDDMYRTGKSTHHYGNLCCGNRHGGKHKCKLCSDFSWSKFKSKSSKSKFLDKMELRGDLDYDYFTTIMVD